MGKREKVLRGAHGSKVESSASSSSSSMSEGRLSAGFGMGSESLHGQQYRTGEVIVGRRTVELEMAEGSCGGVAKL